MRIFENFEDLQEREPKLARKLLSDRGRGSWQKEEIYGFSDKESFAEYELEEGWYASMGLGEGNFRGAPNPMDFINMDKFADALIDSWDESTNWTDGTVILQTSYGW